jgi:hypothetical protein
VAINHQIRPARQSGRNDRSLCGGGDDLGVGVALRFIERLVCCLKEPFPVCRAINGEGDTGRNPGLKLVILVSDGLLEGVEESDSSGASDTGRW